MLGHMDIPLATAQAEGQQIGPYLVTQDVTV